MSEQKSSNPADTDSGNRPSKEWPVERHILLWCAIAVVGAGLLYGLLRGRGLATSEIEVMVADVADTDTADKWPAWLATQWKNKADGGWVQDQTGRNILVTALDGDFHSATFQAYRRGQSKKQKVGVAVVCKGTMSSAHMEELKEITAFARANDMKVMALTNSPAVAARFLVLPKRSLIYPWVLLFVLAGGCCGGFSYALTQQSSFKITIPVVGKKVDTGVAGNMAVGAGAGLVLVALAVKGFGLDLDPLFRWPYETDGVHAMLQVFAVAIVGGYLGITLLDRISEEVLKKMNALDEDVKEQQTLLKEQQKLLEEQQTQLEEQRRLLSLQKADVADSLALNAKAIYASNFTKKATDFPKNLLKEIRQSAEKSNALKENALAMIMLAEVERSFGENLRAVQYYDKALGLLPDRNLLEPDDIHFNRACALSMMGDVRRLPEIIRDLENYLKKPGAKIEELWGDPELSWATSQPDFQKHFPKPSAAK